MGGGAGCAAVKIRTPHKNVGEKQKKEERKEERREKRRKEEEKVVRKGAAA